MSPDPIHLERAARAGALQRLLEAPDVLAQLEVLPAALGDVAKRLGPLARHAKDAEALAALEAVRERCWALWLACAKARRGT